MGLFDDAIAAGFAAAEDAWGQSFTLAGVQATFTGTFDRHRDAAKPELGGYLPELDASIVASKTQFLEAEPSYMLDENGDAIEGEDGNGIEEEESAEAYVPRVGQRLTTGGVVYLINAVEDDSHSYTLMLRSVHR